MCKEKIAQSCAEYNFEYEKYFPLWTLLTD